MRRAWETKEAAIRSHDYEAYCERGPVDRQGNPPANPFYTPLSIPLQDGRRKSLVGAETRSEFL